VVEVIPNDAGKIAILYEPEFSAICSVGDAPFNGRLVIQYVAHDDLLEFESFERWIRENANTRTTIEGYCKMAFDVLNEVLGDIPLAVSVIATTTVHAPVEARIERLYDE
jgi:NADPH-dependent 7-cyano-7-deazaguanine reductase QueF